MKIAVFYHVAKMNGEYWKTVDNEIMQYLKDSNLLDNVQLFNRLELTDFKLFEFPTLEFLREFARNHKDYYILYIHTKGVTNEKQSVSDWRKSMLYFLVTKWRDCVSYLDENDCVGCNYLSKPANHFQGNFFWTKSSYVSNLCEIKDSYTWRGERDKCEMWILSGKAKVVNMYHHNINPYFVDNPESNYKF